MYDKIKELELQVRDLEKEVAELSGYKEETVWRLVEEDFLQMLDQHYPEMPNHIKDNIINKAFDKFSIDDWSEYVEVFIDLHTND